MTIGSTSPARVSFNCDGVSTVFPVPIQAYQNTDLTVILTAPAASGGGESVLVLNSDYSLAPSGSLQPTAWTLTTLGVNPYAAGYTLQVFVNPIQQQQTQYVQGQAFPSLAVQTNLDRLTQMVQRLQDQVGRSIRAQDGDVAPAMLLPNAASRTNSSLMLDANGNIALGVPNTQVITIGLLAPFLQLQQTGAEAAAGVVPTNLAYAPGVVDRYGTNTIPGTTDMTNAIRSAVLAARASGGTGWIRFLSSTYLVTGTVVAGSDTLASVDVLGPVAEWYGSDQYTLITANFNGPVFSVEGTSLAAFCIAGLFEKIMVVNTNTGANACVIGVGYTGGLRTENCWFRANNICVYSVNGGECDSAEFRETICDAPSAPATLGIAGYRFFGRGCRWWGGRTYSFQYAYDISGDDPTFYGVDAEFCEVIFRHQAATSLSVFGSHFETSQVLITNATTVPINLSGAWADNGSAGIGITGKVKFSGCTIALVNANSNMAVIKSQAGFSYALEFDGCALAGTTNPIIGNSFTPGTSVALPSGTQLFVRASSGLVINKPPNDAYSGYILENPSAPGYTDVSGLKINGHATNTYYDANTYVPVLTNITLGNGTLSGEWERNGNEVTVTIHLQLGSTTSITGAMGFSLPFNNSQIGHGAATAVHQGTGVATGVVYVANNVAQLYTPAASASASFFGAAVPFAWASTDVLDMTFKYFAA